MEKGQALGEIIQSNGHMRDAVHVAVAPVTAAEHLKPCMHVGFVSPGDTEMVGLCDHPIGIVDPFLKQPVEAGQRFWLCLYPGTITSLRHSWQNPKSPIKDAIKHRCEAHDYRRQTLAHLADNEDDVAVRLAFADWLDDQGEQKEGRRQRQWPAAKQWFESMMDGGSGQSGFTFKQIIEAGETARLHWLRRPKQARAEVICGSDHDLSARFRQTGEEFWEHWSIITGLEMPEERGKPTTFKCAKKSQKINKSLDQQ